MCVVFNWCSWSGRRIRLVECKPVKFRVCALLATGVKVQAEHLRIAQISLSVVILPAVVIL